MGGAMRLKILRPVGIILTALLFEGCVNATVDEMTYNEPVAGIG